MSSLILVFQCIFCAGQRLILLLCLIIQHPLRPIKAKAWFYWWLGNTLNVTRVGDVHIIPHQDRYVFNQLRNPLLELTFIVIKYNGFNPRWIHIMLLSLLANSTNAIWTILSGTFFQHYNISIIVITDTQLLKQSLSSLSSWINKINYISTIVLCLNINCAP